MANQKEPGWCLEFRCEPRYTSSSWQQQPCLATGGLAVWFYSIPGAISKNNKLKCFETASNDLKQPSNSPSLHYSNSITPPLHYSTTPLLHHSITPPLHYSTTPLLHYSIAAIQYHCITAKLYHCITNIPEPTIIFSMYLYKKFLPCFEFYPSLLLPLCLHPVCRQKAHLRRSENVDLEKYAGIVVRASFLSRILSRKAATALLPNIS
jgi:hypothetical protein